MIRQTFATITMNTHYISHTAALSMLLFGALTGGRVLAADPSDPSSHAEGMDATHLKDHVEEILREDSITRPNTEAKYLTAPIPAEWDAGGIPRQVYPEDDEWWHQFEDTTLMRLITLADRNNYSLSQATRRIEISRQMVEGAKAGYYPTLGVSGGWNLSGASGMNVAPGGAATHGSFFSLGAQMQWEIDVFGRITQNVRTQKLGVKVSRADRAAALTSLCAQVAVTYINMRIDQSTLSVLQSHLQSQQRVADIVQARYEAGLVSKLDVLQAASVLTQTRLSIPPVEASVIAARNALATLCGVNASELDFLGAGGQLPIYRGFPDIGRPEEVLYRRPDVAAAEWQIEQLAASVGVARKDFLPTVGVQASVGTQAHDAGNLFSKNSLTYLVAPTISWSVFEGMGRNARLAQAKLNMENAIDDYNAVILTAVQETNNALAQCRATMQQNVLTMQSVDESRSVFNLSLERYKLGLTDFTTVSQSIISLLQSENNLVQSKGAYLISVINLYKALGGGWRVQ